MNRFLWKWWMGCASLIALVALAVIGHTYRAAAAPDWKAVEQAIGKTGTLMPGGVYRVGLARTDLTATFNGAHQYHGTLFAKSEKSNTAYGTLTQSDTAVSAGDLTGAVGSLTSSLNKTDKILRLKGALISGDEMTAMSCTFKELTRTDTADPGAACP